MQIVKEKIEQVYGLLEELKIDLWLIFVRETMMQADPMLPLVVGQEVVWQSFFGYSRDRHCFALVGNFDEENFRRAGCFDDVLTYTSDVSSDINTIIEKLKPGNIAVNYSENNPAADGLTHGMYKLLKKYLKPLNMKDNLISAEELCTRLRSRKTSTELERLTEAARMANDAWDMAVKEIRVGMTEKEIAAVIDNNIKARGAEPSFSTIVNAGDKTEPGHSLPSHAVLEPGDLLHVDFGVKFRDYCSDLQRLLYFKRPGENRLPEPLPDAFETVRDIIKKTGEASVPGVKGFEVDNLAREMLEEHGFPVYQHALGHQLGRDVHDGGAIIGPRWPRYGATPEIELAENNVFTLELEINLPGIGCVGLEEDMRVTENGAVFLYSPQEELPIK